MQTVTTVCQEGWIISGKRLEKIQTRAIPLAKDMPYEYQDAMPWQQFAPVRHEISRGYAMAGVVEEEDELPYQEFAPAYFEYVEGKPWQEFAPATPEISAGNLGYHLPIPWPDAGLTDNLPIL